MRPASRSSYRSPLPIECGEVVAGCRTRSEPAPERRNRAAAVARDERQSAKQGCLPLLARRAATSACGLARSRRPPCRRSRRRTSWTAWSREPASVPRRSVRPRRRRHDRPRRKPAVCSRGCSRSPLNRNGGASSEDRPMRRFDARAGCGAVHALVPRPGFHPRSQGMRARRSRCYQRP
jgi:hypothetical protein